MLAVAYSVLLGHRLRQSSIAALAADRCTQGAAEFTCSHWTACISAVAPLVHLTRPHVTSCSVRCEGAGCSVRGSGCGVRCAVCWVRAVATANLHPALQTPIIVPPLHHTSFSPASQLHMTVRRVEMVRTVASKSATVFIVLVYSTVTKLHTTPCRQLYNLYLVRPQRNRYLEIHIQHVQHSEEQALQTATYNTISPLTAAGM